MRTPPRFDEITAVFGGTFDPPHRGHTAAIRGLFLEPRVARVVVVPSAVPPHKPSVASAEDRLAMARLAFERSRSLGGEVQVHSCELDRAARGGPTYSFETIQELRGLFPKLAFVIGADQLKAFPTWSRFPDVLGLCHWIVLERKPDGRALSEETLRDWLASGLVAATRQTGLYEVLRFGTFLALTPTDAPAISSSEIRRSIALRGQPPEGALDPEILAYLKQHRLYGTEKHSTLNGEPA